MSARTRRLSFVCLALVACRPVEPDPPVSAPATPTAAPSEPTQVDPPIAATGDIGTASKCTRSFAHLPAIATAEIDAAPITALDELGKIAKPGQRHVLEGFAVAWHACAPCPEGAACKPCESHIVFASSAAVGIKQPITKEMDLWVMTPDPEAFVRGTPYRIVVDVCDGASPTGGIAHVEWRATATR